MRFTNPYWSNQTRMGMLERWILVHSILYYEWDTSIVSDAMFDANCIQLLEMIKGDQEAFRRSEYYKAFKEFDGNTGFDLFTKLRKSDKMYLMQIAAHILKTFKTQK